MSSARIPRDPPVLIYSYPFIFLSFHCATEPPFPPQKPWMVQYPYEPVSYIPWPIPYTVPNSPPSAITTFEAFNKTIIPPPFLPTSMLPAFQNEPISPPAVRLYPLSPLLLKSFHTHPYTTLQRTFSVPTGRLHVLPSDRQQQCKIFCRIFRF